MQKYQNAENKNTSLYVLYFTTLAFAKYKSEREYSGSTDAWENLTNWTKYIDARPSTPYKIEAGLTCRLRTGSKIDDFYIRVAIECNGLIYYSDEHFYRPDEDNDEHDNYKPIHYLDYQYPCGGNYTSKVRFRLQVKNTGDDGWWVRDCVLFVTQY